MPQVNAVSLAAATGDARSPVRALAAGHGRIEVPATVKAKSSLSPLTKDDGSVIDGTTAVASSAASNSPVDALGEEENAEPDFGDAEEPHDEPVTWGRTFAGQDFRVPRTQDVIQSLFYPSNPQTVFEWTILGVLAVELAVFLASSAKTNRIVFMALFGLWRALYDVGLGILLKGQSDRSLLVRMAKRFGISATPSKRRGPWAEYVVTELRKKIGVDEEGYKALPIEFSTWVLFRGLVDLILVNDLICYALFAISHFEWPADNQFSWVDWARFLGGTLMVVFNFLVNMDAKRVIKDFAWYWGDFFFLIDTSPTVSGVFEMAPHPMYSVGYVGLYGAALIVKSYTVLFVSLAAHAAQLLFLVLVESPHMEKIYKTSDSTSADNIHDKKVMQDYFRRDLIIFRNFDWFRSTDLLTLGFWLYTAITAVMIGPIENDNRKFYFYIGQAVFWRIMYNWVLGLVLHLQSTNKFWSRHFIKYGETPKEAFNQWKILFNLSQSMTYITFFICACRLYAIPENWFYGTVLLKHIVAVVLIGLHMWIAVSIHNSLGDFGWFYGDFFIDSLRDSHNLTYTGIYRFLNHPNAWAATASAWGITIACSSWSLMWLTIFGQASNWLFVRHVELPHMKRRYGTDAVRPQREAGMERVLREGVGRIEGHAKAVMGEVVKDLNHRWRGRINNLRRVVSTSRIWDGGVGRMAHYDDDESSHATSDRLGPQSDEEGDDANSLVHPVAGDDDENSGIGAGADGVTLFFSPPKPHQPRRRGSRIALMDKMSVPRSKGHFKSKSESEQSNLNSTSSGSEGDNEDEDDEIEILHPTSRSTPSHGVNSWGSSSISSIEGLLGVSGSFISGSPNSSRPNSFSETMKQAVSKTKPRVSKMVQDAKMIVTKRVERLANVARRRTSASFPLHLYSVTFPTSKEDSDIPIVFRLGEPISIKFTCARETLRRRDWIGIYGAGHNLSTQVTTSRNNLWIFVTSSWHREDDDEVSGPLITKFTRNNSDHNAASTQLMSELDSNQQAVQKTALQSQSVFKLGSTIVTVTQSEEDAGLRIVEGTITFRRSKLPWHVGAFEARYHLDGGYSVLAISHIFEIVAEPFNWDDEATQDDQRDQNKLEAEAFGDRLIESSSANSSSPGLRERVVEILRDFVQRCVDIDVSNGCMPLVPDEDILSRCCIGEDVRDSSSLAKYREDVAKRIVYGVRQIFGIEFSWRVVKLLSTVRQFAERIIEARIALSPVHDD